MKKNLITQNNCLIQIYSFIQLNLAEPELKSRLFKNFRCICYLTNQQTRQWGNKSSNMEEGGIVPEYPGNERQTRREKGF